MRQLASVLIIVGVLSQPIAASAQNQPLRFEVTSVKPNSTGRGGIGNMPPSGRVNFEGWTFKMLMKAAYRVQDYQIIGGPAWLAVDRFDVQACPPADFQPQRSRSCFADCMPTPSSDHDAGAAGRSFPTQSTSVEGSGLRLMSLHLPKKIN
jgi:hypothetical protein